MEELQSSEAAAFVVEGEVEPIIVKVRGGGRVQRDRHSLPRRTSYLPQPRAAVLQGIEAHLKDTTYDDRNVATWINYICEDIVQALTDLGKPFKYVGAYLLRRDAARVLLPRACLLFTYLLHHPPQCTASSCKTRALGCTRQPASSATA